MWTTEPLAVINGEIITSESESRILSTSYGAVERLSRLNLEEGFIGLDMDGKAIIRTCRE